MTPYILIKEGCISCRPLGLYIFVF